MRLWGWKSTKLAWLIVHSKFDSRNFIQFFNISYSVKMEGKAISRMRKFHGARDFLPFHSEENIIIWIMFTSHDLISLPFFSLFLRAVIENFKFQHISWGPLPFWIAATRVTQDSRLGKNFSRKSEKLCHRKLNIIVWSVKEVIFSPTREPPNGKSKSNFEQLNESRNWLKFIKQWNNHQFFTAGVRFSYCIWSACARGSTSFLLH